MTLFQAFGQFAGSGGVAAASDFDLITSTTFTAASNVNIDNCFSADYNFYQVIYSCSGSIAGEAIMMQLRSGGSSATGANYSRQYMEANSTSFSTARFSAQTAHTFGVTDTIEFARISWFQNPFEAVSTTFWADNSFDFDANITIRTDNGLHTLSNSYDGISFGPTAGTLTGNIQVYGWKV